MTIHQKARDLEHGVIRTLCGRELINGTGNPCKTCDKINAKAAVKPETTLDEWKASKGLANCPECHNIVGATMAEGLHSEKCSRYVDPFAPQAVWDLASIAALADENGVATIDLRRKDCAPAPGTTKKHLMGGVVTYLFHLDGAVTVAARVGGELVYRPLPEVTTVPEPTFTVEGSRDGVTWVAEPDGTQYTSQQRAEERAARVGDLVTDSRFRVVRSDGTVMIEQSVTRQTMMDRTYAARISAEARHAAQQTEGPARYRAPRGKRKRHGRGHR